METGHDWVRGEGEREGEREGEGGNREVKGAERQRGETELGGGQ